MWMSIDAAPQDADSGLVMASKRAPRSGRLLGTGNQIQLAQALSQAAATARDTDADAEADGIANVRLAGHRRPRVGPGMGLVYHNVDAWCESRSGVRQRQASRGGVTRPPSPHGPP